MTHAEKQLLHEVLPVMCSAAKEEKNATPIWVRAHTVADMVVSDDIPVAVIVPEKKLNM